MRIGFIGVGFQGAPMARRIMDAGYETVLWARRAASLDPFDGLATVAPSAAALAAECDVVCVCVVNDSDVLEVVGQMLPSLKRGSSIVIHSTITPSTCEEIASMTAPRGVSVVDAPVSGGAPAAEAGTLLVMVGGADADVGRVRPVLETFGDPIVHLGPLGSGEYAKLVNNVLFVAHLGLASDAYELGRQFGIDASALSQVLCKGSGNSFAVPIMSERSLPEMGELAGSLLHKDVNLVSSAARGRNTDAAEALLSAANAALAHMGLPKPAPHPS